MLLCNVSALRVYRSSGLMQIPDVQKAGESAGGEGSCISRAGSRSGSVLTVDRPAAPSSPRGSRLDLSRLHFELPRFSSAKPPTGKSEVLSSA